MLTITTLFIIVLDILTLNMIHMLKPVMDKVDIMQKQMGNVSKEMEILRKIQKKCYRSKTL